MPPDLTTALGPKLTLPSPFIAASGTFGYGSEIADLADLRVLGALTTPTLTVEARGGSPMPRTLETAAGLLTATGLPNPGLEVFLAETLPAMQSLGCPILVSIRGETTEEWLRLAQALTAAGGIAALELNLRPGEWVAAASPPVSIPTESEILQHIGEAVQAVRGATELPLIAKLPLFGAEIGAAARTAVVAGADVLAVSAGFPGVAVRLSGAQFRFPGVVGTLSGPAIKPLALYQVWRAAQVVTVPILGGGGVMTAEDTLEFLLAGASAVSVGIAGMIHPNIIAQLTADLIAYMEKSKIDSVEPLIGSAR